MLAFQVDGVLIAAVSDRSRPHLKLLTRTGVPFVLVDRSVAGFDTDLVQGDSVAGARQLVEHLIGLGHRRIAMITDERSDVSTARDRVRGYREALEAAGIPFLPELVAETSTVDPSLAYQATLDLLDHVEPPTALFAVNNIVVIGVAEAARARSLEIPRDIAVVCFDDIDHASRFHPFLTAMIQPAETFGTVATQLLLDRLAGRVHERRRVVVLPSDLIVRESCGAQLPVR
jgi:LacI family transcriptional regulator